MKQLEILIKRAETQGASPQSEVYGPQRPEGQEGPSRSEVATYLTLNGLAAAGGIDPPSQGSRTFIPEVGPSLTKRYQWGMDAHNKELLKQTPGSLEFRRSIPGSTYSWMKPENAKVKNYMARTGNVGMRGLGPALAYPIWKYREDQIMNGGEQRGFYGSGSWQDRLNTGMEIGAAGLDTVAISSDAAALADMGGRAVGRKTAPWLMKHPRLLRFGRGAGALTRGAAGVGMAMGPLFALEAAYEGGKLYRDGLIHAMQEDEAADEALQAVDEDRLKAYLTLRAREDTPGTPFSTDQRALVANIQQQREASNRFHFANDGMEDLQVGPAIMKAQPDGTFSSSNVSTAAPSSGNTWAGALWGPIVAGWDRLTGKRAVNVHQNKLNAPQSLYEDRAGEVHTLPEAKIPSDRDNSGKETGEAVINPYQMQIRELQAENVTSRLPLVLRPFAWWHGTGPTRPLTEEDLEQQWQEREQQRQEPVSGFYTPNQPYRLY